MTILKNRLFWAMLGLICALGFAGFRLVQGEQEKARSAAVKELGKSLIQEGLPLDLIKRPTDPAQEKERRDRWKQFGEERKKLSKEEQGKVDREMQKQFVAIAKPVINMPKSQRNLILDFFIDRMEKDQKDRDKRNRERAAQGTADPANSSASTGPSGAEGNRSPEARAQRTRQFLEGSDPEFRAVMFEGMRIFNERRRERGLPPMPMGGRGR